MNISRILILVLCMMVFCSFTPVLSARDSSGATVPNSPSVSVVSTNPPMLANQTEPVPSNQGARVMTGKLFIILVTFRLMERALHIAGTLAEQKI